MGGPYLDGKRPSELYPLLRGGIGGPTTFWGRLGLQKAIFTDYGSFEALVTFDWKLHFGAVFGVALLEDSSL